MCDKLLARREGHRIQADKLCDNIEQLLMSDDPVVSVVRVNVNELHKQFGKICNLDDEIQDSIPVASIADDIAEVTARSIKIEDVLFRSSDILNGGKKEAPADNHIRNVKLPTIELPKFDGSYLDWQNFWDLYETSVHNRADLGNAS